ncbi:MAG TPA: hypothetical protein PLS49_00575 [Candidatus Woesebacteria bacterium]|nr:hypothetical protein [Candidatus Woesebacteria bacterium]
MLTGKKGPILLISLLVIILVFIVGMNYGKKVEEADKTIRYVLSLTPSPNPSMLEPQITYIEYTNETCGFSFLYPSNFILEKEASSEAILSSKDKSIQIHCGQEIAINNKKATSEALLDNKDGLLLTDDTELEYRVRNTDNKLIIISVTKILGPLIEKTFSFTN